jgi:hypothetical protein
MHLDDMNTQPPSAIGGLNVTLLAGLLVASVVIIVATSVALIVYVVRHRRLQQSFTSFANSHFDNRRGTTTFGSNDLGQLVCLLRMKLVEVRVAVCFVRLNPRLRF